VKSKKMLDIIIEHYNWASISSPVAHAKCILVNSFNLSGMGKTTFGQEILPALQQRLDLFEHQNAIPSDVKLAIRNGRRVFIDFNGMGTRDSFHSSIDIPNAVNFITLRLLARGFGKHTSDFLFNNTSITKEHIALFGPNILFSVLVKLARSGQQNQQEPILLLLHLDEIQLLPDTLPNGICAERFIKDIYWCLCGQTETLWREFRILLLVLATGTLAHGIDPTQQTPYYIHLSVLSSTSIFNYLANNFLELFGQQSLFRSKKSYAVSALHRVICSYGLVATLLPSLIASFQPSELPVSSTTKHNEANIALWISRIIKKLDGVITTKLPPVTDELKWTSEDTWSLLCQCSLMRLPLPELRHVRNEIDNLQRVGMLQGDLSESMIPTIIIPYLNVFAAKLELNKPGDSSCHTALLHSSLKDCICSLVELPTTTSKGTQFEKAVASSIRFLSIFNLTHRDENHYPKLNVGSEKIVWSDIFKGAKHLGGRDSHFLKSDFALNLDFFARKIEKLDKKWDYANVTGLGNGCNIVRTVKEVLI